MDRRDKRFKDYFMDFYILRDEKRDAIIAVKPTLEEAVYAREKYENDMVKFLLSVCHTEEEREEVRPKYALHRVKYNVAAALIAKDRERAIEGLREKGMWDDADDEIDLD